MKLISKIKISTVMLEWNIRGWIDKESPSWFRIMFWGMYHTIHEDKFMQSQQSQDSGM